MAAWMQACSACVQIDGAASMPALASSQSCPLEARAQIASVVAGIILNQHLEAIS